MITSDVQKLFAQIAERNLGFVTAPQARALGITPAELTEAVQRGLLISARSCLRYPAGVYRFSAHPSRDIGREWLVVTWIGFDPATAAAERVIPESGVVSHETAAQLHGLRLSSTYDFTFPPSIPEPTVRPAKETKTGGTQNSEARMHIKPIARDECEYIDGLPVTGVKRTMADLIRDSTLDARKIGNLLLLVLERNLVDRVELSKLIARPAFERFRIPEPNALSVLMECAVQSPPFSEVRHD